MRVGVGGVKCLGGDWGEIATGAELARGGFLL